VIHAVRSESGALDATHKFHVGEIVHLSASVTRNVPGGSYQVVKLLPASSGEFEYRIKSMNEPHERVVRESELRKS
jgi:hypothetical protein